jgi:RNA polymerase sigma-70 factor (ECF subfamily)
MNKSDYEYLDVYESLFIRNFESLCLFVYSYIPDIEVAKDIVQDTFVSLWQNRDKYQTTNTLLYTVAKNKSIDYLKANDQTKILKGIHFDITTNLPQANNDEESELSEIAEEIWKYVETLPTQCKKIFILSRLDNLKNREIANQLDISIKAVEKQITKALNLIRLHLQERDILFIILLISIFF